MKFAYYIILIIGFQQVLHAQLRQEISLKTGMLTYNAVDEMDEKEFLSSNSYDDVVYGVVVFHRIPDDEQLNLIKSAGLDLKDFLGQNSYLCRFRSEDFNTIKKIPVIRGFGSLKPEYKISPRLAREIAQNTGNQRLRYEVNIMIFSSELSKSFSQRLIDAGIKAASNKNAEQIFKARLSAEEILKIASIACVVYIENQPPPGEKEDTGARNLHRTNIIDQQYSAGLKYDGTGVNVLVRDDGKIGPHIDYKGRTDQNHATGISSYATHGDMVSGVLMGGGNLDPDVPGTAKGAFLYLTDYESEFLDETMQLYKDKHVLITSSSYSDGCNTGYTMNAQTTDRQIFNNKDLMHVFSAGNSGLLNCDYGAGAGWGNITGGHKMGKNSIAVGNVTQTGSIDNTSSRGPASDGRIKPDLVANGTNQLSTFPDNTIKYGGGTSAAAPGISGVLAQLYQVYKELNNGESPPSALIKAAVLNSTTDLGTRGPDFIYGWGLVNARKAYELLSKKHYEHLVLGQKQLEKLSLNVPAGTVNLRVMIYWADKEASLLSKHALVNDFDLTLTNPFNKVYFPYVLDTSFNSSLLGTAAQNGEDHLNNMEQVEVSNPVPGIYTINISGYQLPFGKSDFWVVFEMTTADPVLVYPNGGESLNAGEKVTVQWDAFGNTDDFVLDYSTDGKQSWYPLKTLAGNMRKTTWNLPELSLDSIYLRIRRGSLTDISEAPFTILGQIKDLKINKICPDSAQLSWSLIEGASKYVLFELGEKYMEAFDTVSGNFAKIANDPGRERWISVAPVSVSGMPGKRCVAQKMYKLKNCVQAVDLAILPDKSLAPTGIFCEAGERALSAVVKNEGLDTVKNFTIHYKTALNPLKSKQLTETIIPGDSVSIVFDTILVDKNISFDLKAWVDANSESAHYNDTLDIKFNWLVQESTGTTLPYSQDFESSEFPPLFWTTLSTDNEANWDTLSCTGINGQITTAAWINNFNNLITGSTDDLITQKFDLTDVTEAYLVFEHAYSGFDMDYNDTLAVDLSLDCAVSFPYRLFYQGGTELQSVSYQQTAFVPLESNQWRVTALDLKDYLGKVVTFRFRNISGYANSLFIDNIRVVQKISPKAIIYTSTDRYCIGVTDSVKFQANVTPYTSYFWKFGTGAQPAVASGSGPHYVSYNTAGESQVKLLVSTQNEADSISVNIQVNPTTEATFGFIKNGLSYEFIPDQSLPSTMHWWSFGDTETSQEEQPVHIYATHGEYLVTHYITDECGQDTATQTLLITSVHELQGGEFSIFPNPASDELNILSAHTIDRILLLDVLGNEMNINNTDKLKECKLNLHNIRPGMYFLNLWTDGNRHVFKININKL